MKVQRRMIHIDTDGTKTVTYREVTWEEVRHNRDVELAQSDWRAMKDRILSTEWKDYRAALRELPQVHDNADDAADNWPVMPQGQGDAHELWG